MDVREYLNTEITEQNAITILETMRREFNIGYVIETLGSDKFKLSLIRWGDNPKTIARDLEITGDFVTVVKVILIELALEYDPVYKEQFFLSLLKYLSKRSQLPIG